MQEIQYKTRKVDQSARWIFLNIGITWLKPIESRSLITSNSATSESLSFDEHTTSDADNSFAHNRKNDHDHDNVYICPYTWRRSKR